MCLEAGLRRGAQAGGSAGTRSVCWGHVGRGRNRENESILKVGKRREKAAQASGRPGFASTSRVRSVCFSDLHHPPLLLA